MTEDRQFLELSVPSADIRASLAWYRGLGMAEFATNDVRQTHYAVVGTEDFAIGLHAAGATEPGLTFVQPNMAGLILDRMDRGEEFVRAELGVDSFHEAVQADPNGTWATLIEARTFSPGLLTEAPLAINHFHSLKIPCMQVDATVEFWQTYGFIAVTTDTGDTAEMHMAGLQVDLEAGTPGISVRFLPDNYDSIVAALNGRYKLRMIRDSNLTGVELVAPEGTRVQLMRVA